MKHIKILFSISLLMAMLPMAGWAQGGSGVIEEAGAAVNFDLEGLLALGADTQAGGFYRWDIYLKVFEWAKENEAYARYGERALEGLLAWGADTQADIYYRWLAYKTVFECAEENKAYAGYEEKVLEGLLALGADTQADDRNRRNAYFKIFDWAKGNEAYRKYSNQAMAQLSEDGETSVSKEVIKDVFETWSVADTEALIRHETFPALLTLWDSTHKIELLQVLVTREYGGRAFAPIIEVFEALSGVFRADLIRQEAAANLAWSLRDAFQAGGIAELEAYLDNRAVVGIVTSSGLTFDSITKVGNKRMQDDPEIVVAYVTEDIIGALGIERFSGLLFPGSGDNYPGHLPEFTLEDMPNSKRTTNEVLYQKIYNMAKTANVPTFGICSGAQHLVLNRGGSLMKNKNYNANVNVPALTPLHYMMLGQEEQKALLEKCAAKDFQMNVFRAHSYAGVEGKLGEEVELSIIDGQTPLGFSVGFEAIGTQFHPESRYQGVSPYAGNDAKGRQTNLLNFFFEICKAQHRFVEAAKERGQTREEGIAQLRAYMGGILKRLNECKAGREVAGEMSWEEVF